MVSAVENNKTGSGEVRRGRFGRVAKFLRRAVSNENKVEDYEHYRASIPGSSP